MHARGTQPSRRDRLEWEFGVYSLWLAQTIAALDGDRIAAACRGTGNPVLFERLLGEMHIDPSSLVLDLGSGIGGPTEWLRDRVGCRAVGVEIMPPGAAGAALLFPCGTWVVGDSAHLPFADACFDAAWALGSLETVENKEAALGEAARVLREGARFLVYAFVPVGEIADPPVADVFEPGDVLSERMRAAGFTVDEGVAVPELRRSPDTWLRRRHLVETEVARRHGDDPRYPGIRQQLDKMSALWHSGSIEPWLFVAERAGG